MMDSSAHPHVYAAAAASAAGVTADVVHSTSWRMEGERIVLTYIVVSENALGEESFDVHRDHDHAEASEPGHGETQLCDATSAPVIVDELDVVHHALHHLALLAQTNAAIARSLTPVALAALLPLAPMGAGVLESA